MVGTIIGGALGLGASIVGNIAAAREAHKAREVLAKREADNQAWYDRRYNEDATQRADAQRLLSITEERIRQRNKAAAGRAAVMGGTDESIAVTKAAGNEALANAVGHIAAEGARRKDAIEAQYEGRKDALAQQRAATHTQQAGAITSAASTLAQVGANIATTLDEPKANPNT